MGGKISGEIPVDRAKDNLTGAEEKPATFQDTQQTFHSVVEKKSRIYQIKMLLDQAPMALVGGLLAGALFIAGLWSVADHTHLLTWYSLLIGFSFLRLFIVIKYRQDPSPDYFLWERRFFITLPVMGLIWGLGALYFLIGAPLAHQTLIFFFCLGLISGVIISYAAHFKMVLISSLPIIVPTLIFFAIQDSWYHRVMALATLLFFITVFRAMSTLSRFLDKSFSLAAELQEEIVERKFIEESLIKTKESLEEANLIKDDFVSLVSHDLKAPLGSLSMALSLLQEKGAQGRMKISDRITLGRAKATCDGLLGMVEKLLDINMLRSGRIKPQKKFIETRSFITSLTERLAHAAEEYGIAFDIDIPSGQKIFVDRDMFGQVIQNLVHNAIKFCGDGDVITIFLPDGTSSVIGVKDTGLGVAENFIDDLFRADKQTSSHGMRGEKGSGYGLPLCQDIMKAHGGKLTFKSAAGMGSSFFCELPKTDAVVLVVDDQEAARMEIIRHLDGLDVEIIEAASDHEAMVSIINVKPQLIITDIKMPGVSGFQFLEKLRNTSVTESIPVIVMTSDHDAETRERAFDLGAKDFVTKPIIPNDFLPRIKRFISC